MSQLIFLYGMPKIWDRIRVLFSFFFGGGRGGQLGNGASLSHMVKNTPKTWTSYQKAVGGVKTSLKLLRQVGKLFQSLSVNIPRDPPTFICHDHQLKIDTALVKKLNIQRKYNLNQAHLLNDLGSVRKQESRNSRKIEISEIGKIPRRAMGNAHRTLPHPVHYIHTGTCLISASLQIHWRWHLLIIWATLVCENQRQSKFVFEIMRACLPKQIFSSLINGNT